MALQLNKNDSFALPLIGVVSVLIPIVVAILVFLPDSGRIGDLDFSFVPHLNAVINSTVSVLLVLAVVQIKRKNIAAHKTLMMSNLVLSAIFLVGYIAYHYSVPPTRHPGGGFELYSYYFVLITHIVLAALVVPFVLLSFYFSLSNQIERHKKISRWTFPMWLYVSVTGVITYLMISPYYAS